MELRAGEVIVRCAGGKCFVCKQKVPAGDAVQKSSESADVRHVECLPVYIPTQGRYYKNNSFGVREGRRIRSEASD